MTTVGQACNNQNIEISSKDECQQAANELDLPFAHAWNGPGDFPACLYAKDGRNQVYYNLSPNPGRIHLNSNYAAICRVNGKIKMEMQILKYISS